MDKASHVPPPEPTINHRPPANSRRRLVRAVVPLAAVVIVIILGLLFAGPGKNNQKNSSAAHLLLNNSDKSSVVMANASGKQLYSVSYPKFSYLNFEASSPKGEILLSNGISTGNESFLFIVGGKSQDLNKTAQKALSSAIVLNNSHQVFFTDENDVVYVACPSGAGCKLTSLDLSSGTTKTIVDIGSKSIIPQLPPAYPLGTSQDKKTIYVRTTAASKLGGETGAVYAVDMNGKVTKHWSLPADADYTANLSPDASQIAYKTLGDKSQIKISVLNLKTGKTAAATWTKGALTDQPNTFAWSPDSSKVLFWGSNSIMPHPKPDSTFDINMAYFGPASSKITDLQTIKDSAHNMIASLGWLDSSDVVYERDSASQAYVFSDKNSKIYKQNVGTKTVDQLNNLSSSLVQTVYY